jgi:hypothetical protein
MPAAIRLMSMCTSTASTSLPSPPISPTTRRRRPITDSSLADLDSGAGLSFGTHKIEIYAAESQQNVSVLIGTQYVTNHRPIGVVESLSATTIIGWAADPDQLGESLTVKVYVNGELAVTDVADTARADLLPLAPLSSRPSFAAYGFSLALPTLDAGTNRIDVYAVDLNNGELSSLGSMTVVV